MRVNCLVVSCKLSNECEINLMIYQFVKCFVVQGQLPEPDDAEGISNFGKFHKYLAMRVVNRNKVYGLEVCKTIKTIRGAKGKERYRMKILTRLPSQISWSRT